jgi:hypothetical protein
LSLAWAARFGGGAGGIQIKSTPLMVTASCISRPQPRLGGKRAPAADLALPLPANRAARSATAASAVEDWLFFVSPDSN